MTASSEWVEPFFLPQQYHGASEARLNNSYVLLPDLSGLAGIWAPKTLNLNQYIQVCLYTLLVSYLVCFKSHNSEMNMIMINILIRISLLGYLLQSEPY